MNNATIDYFVRKAQDALGETDITIFDDGTVIFNGKSTITKVFDIKQNTITVSAQTKERWEAFLNRPINVNEAIPSTEIKQRLVELCPAKQGFGARNVKTPDNKRKWQVCSPDIKPSLIPNRIVEKRWNAFLDAMEVLTVMTCQFIKELKKGEK